MAAEDEIYLRTHERRYQLLLGLVEELQPARILVVGPSYESALLREALPEATVNSLGWLDHRFPLRDRDQHVQFDLNDDTYPELQQHDVVVCAEVLEHLRVATVPVLRFFASGLRSAGVLILQTPNAVSLPKRLRMLLGRNPYDPIRENPLNPGHFHEFTLHELLHALEEAGLRVERWLTENYFDHGSRKNRAFRAVGSVLPATLREGITVVARRP
ncbi:MAG TPA: methyltransferase domain-containing protein [Gaiellaceae bacterium]|nr:methyltransferase domain-containing protein [Gaiellaceae bacterium]